MNQENLPIILNCENTLCLRCYEKMIDTNSKCFFNKNHDHIGQPKIINRDLLNIINEYDKKKSIVEPNPVIK